MAENLDMETYYRRYKQNAGRELFLETPNALIGKVPNIGPEDLSMVAKTGSAQAKGLISTTAGTFPAIVGIFAGLGNMMTDDPEKKGNWEQFAAGYDTIPFTPEKIKQQFTDWGWDPKSENELEQMIINLNETMGDVVAPGKIYGAETLVKGVKGIASGAKLAKERLAKTNNMQGFNDSFIDWFDRSKAVDKDNQPLVLYHGTTSTFDKFERPSNVKNVKRGGIVGSDGIFFSPSPDVANSYARRQLRSMFDGSKSTSGSSVVEGAQVKPVYLNIKKPYVINDDSIPRQLQKFITEMRGKKYFGDDNKVARKDQIDKLIEQGYDGIIVKHKPSYLDENIDEYIVFDDSQVLSTLSDDVGKVQIKETTKGKK